ncbi:hypothetical protein GCM10023187_12200 [Nibrella viscosa]|uniref:CubicO group peptidase, beta-lactamase class C family n=1 Tax=Nibrella viscosa TaxID=1084524 RepID=A0ABP8K2R8_9BACT
MALTFDGPETSETAQPNPFRDYRLDVTFVHAATGEARRVAGFYAADGRAGETSATGGNKWRVYFAPNRPGEWRWSVSFRTGTDVTVADDENAGRPWQPLHGQAGRFSVSATDKKAPDLRGRGALEYVGKRYLRFAGDSTWFLKSGVGSPETLLGYADFDGTFRDVSTDHRPPAPNGIIALPALKDGLMRYEPHVPDWRPGDPAWQNGKGKGLIGGINYLADQGINAMYFLTMNVNGDGRNVWPWTEPWTRDRFDCSRLDQWEVVFGHMTRRGMMLHIVLQETENDHLLDRGSLGPERKLYLRELVARFAHHPAITWNFGEENVQPVQHQKESMAWLRRLNPYRQNIVIHNDHWHAKNLRETFEPLLGFEPFTGTAIQDFFWNDVPTHVRHFVRASEQSGHPWVVSADELGGANFGTLPDADDPEHNDPRRFGLWGTLMAGGAGAEWYFGWQNNSPNSDLSSQNWRTREAMYRQGRIALDFFQKQLPFYRMQPMAEEIVGQGIYGLAAPDEVYALYLPNGGGTRFDLGDNPGRYEINWFNPRTGGDLRPGTIRQVRGPGLTWTGWPPSETSKDWVAVVRKLPETVTAMAFPTAQWREGTPDDVGVDPVGMQHALNYWRMHTGVDGVEHVVIVRRGVVIYKGAKAEKPVDVRSATKSVTSTLLGLLIANGKVALDTKAAGIEPVLQEKYPHVTLRDFTTMTSGYSAQGKSRWNEPSEDWSPNPYLPDEPLFAPGSQYAYWDEAQMMFGRVLTRVAGRDLLDLANKRIFAPIGFTVTKWGTEGQLGTTPIRNGCTGFTINALDFARFGHLFLNQGRWGNQQVVPADWVRMATRPQVPTTIRVADTDRRGADGLGVYGFNWWVNGVHKDGRRSMPDAPAGTYFAAGLNHNLCIVIPEWDMVIVRLGNDGNPPGGHAQTLNNFLRRLSMAVHPLAEK